MRMTPFFQKALQRSGIDQIPHAKAFWFGTDIPAELFERISFRGLNPEDLEIRYSSRFSPAFRSKPLVRFDFANEWNDLGYGAIRFGGPWGLSGALVCKKGEKIAGIFERATGRFVCDYVVRLEHEGRDVLWMNREVGLIDGYDWSVVEAFVDVPFVDEIPFGYQGALTMRIDCDEAVASGRRLFELYSKFKTPFSVAIKTQQTLASADVSLMADVIADGGSVVGHSHTHAPNWGGGGAATVREVTESRAVLKSLGLGGINYDYMVSPFHQNSVEAVRGLREAGLKGFVSGIICNDPEFLMARSGEVPLVDGIMSHSQQCMFHGDTLRTDPTMAVYDRAFDQAIETRTFFGFLDHPFSNYWYGWASEEERLDAHERFLTRVGRTPGLWRASLADAMKFLDQRSKVRVRRDGSSWVASMPASDDTLPSVGLRWGDRVVELKPGSEVSF